MVLRFLFIALLLLLGCGSEDLEFNNPNDPRNFSHPSGIAYQPFTDSRDGRTYNGVVIGTQTWMAENLNYIPPYEGDYSHCVSYVERDGYIRDTLVSNGDYCDIYGRLYKWEIAKNACPNGWHLPSANEWRILLEFIEPGCSDNTMFCPAGIKLKAIGGWQVYGGRNGTDDYGFTAIFQNPLCWWSSTESSETGNYYFRKVYALTMYTDSDGDEGIGVFTKEQHNMCSIRCIKDGSINYQTCNDQFYDPATQRCGAGNVVETMCGTEWFDATNASLKCESGVLKTKCGNNWYSSLEWNPKTQYCSNGTTVKPYGTLADTRDSKIYKTVEIGTQVWMAENLNYNATNSECNNSEANCNKYGRLYDWETAMKVCPDDWHLPSNANWDVLMVAVGGKQTAGKYLKATSGWDAYDGKSGNGVDAYGFAALPGGSGYPNNGGFGFNEVGIHGAWWSATVGSGSNSVNAYYLAMGSDEDNVTYSIPDVYYFPNMTNKNNLSSVRCVKD